MGVRSDAWDGPWNLVCHQPYHSCAQGSQATQRNATLPDAQRLGHGDRPKLNECVYFYVCVCVCVCASPLRSAPRDAK